MILSHEPCDGILEIYIPQQSTALYKRMVDPQFVIRRVTICCNDVEDDPGILQLNMFDDVSQQIRDRAIQDTILSIRAKYGKNALLKGMNLDEAGTQKSEIRR